MTTDAGYAVKINIQAGTLEVAGPDGEWVDSQVDQLRDLLAATGSAPKKAARATGPAPKDPPNGAGTAARRRARSAGGKAQMDEELRALLDRETTKKLGEYIEARRQAWEDSLSGQAAIIATFLQDEMDRPGIDPNDLYTIYTVMGERPPGNLRSQLTNARQRARYFGGVTDGKWTLSQKGENYGRYDSVASTEGEERAR